MSVTYKVELNNQRLKAFLLSLLDDDEGISERTLEALSVVVDDMFGDDKPKWLSDLWDAIDTSNNRYWIDEDDANNLRKGEGSE